MEHPKKVVKLRERLRRGRRESMLLLFKSIGWRDGKSKRVKQSLPLPSIHPNCITWLW